MKRVCKNINSITKLFLYLSLHKHQYRAIINFGNNKQKNRMAGKIASKEHFDNMFIH